MRRNSGRRRPAIGLTPLIDVVFILLVFFMLASRFGDWRSIRLGPAADGATGAPSAEGAMLVEVRADGLRFAGAVIADAALYARIRDRVAAKPDQRLLVAPDAAVDTQRLVRVLDGLSAAGARSISLLGSQ